MKLRKNSGKILWGLFFILAAVYVVVSKLWIMPEISVFSVLLTVFFIWLFLNGIRNVNFWEILFSIAFICIIYDDWLGITALTPWTVLGAALLGSIGLSLIFKKKSGHSPSISFEFDSDSDNEDGKYIGENIKIDNNFGTAIKYVNSECLTKVVLCFPFFRNVKICFAKAIVNFDFCTSGLDNGIIKVYGKRTKAIIHIRHTEVIGSVKIHGVCEGSSNNTLKLKGETSFGEINIYYI